MRWIECVAVPETIYQIIHSFYKIVFLIYLHTGHPCGVTGESNFTHTSDVLLDLLIISPFLHLFILYTHTHNLLPFQRDHSYRKWLEIRNTDLIYIKQQTTFYCLSMRWPERRILVQNNKFSVLLKSVKEQFLLQIVKF